MPKVIDHDQRRADIIDVTWQLIVKGGLEAATMREIASAAGFANGALKHYFPGKDEIITGTFEKSMLRVAEHLPTALEGKSGIEALRATLLATSPRDEEDVTAARVLIAFWERASVNDDVNAAYARHLENWREGLFEALAAGRAAAEITTTVPDAELVDEIVLMNVGATVMRVLAPGLTTADMLENHIDRFIERLN